MAKIVVRAVRQASFLGHDNWIELAAVDDSTSRSASGSNPTPRRPYSYNSRPTSVTSTHSSNGGSKKSSSTVDPGDLQSALTHASVENERLAELVQVMTANLEEAEARWGRGSCLNLGLFLNELLHCC